MHSAPRPGTSPPSLPSDVVAKSLESSNSKGKQRAVDDEEELEDMGTNRGTVVKMSGSVVEVVQTFPGLSPIVDAVVADIDRSGQSQLVVCSGGQGAGAVKIVRKGAELQEHAVVDGFDHITTIWSLKPRSDAKYVLQVYLYIRLKTVLGSTRICLSRHCRERIAYSLATRRFYFPSSLTRTNSSPTRRQLQLATWHIPTRITGSRVPS
jgi:hypothetical protein